jgi:hypothetical protein
VQRENLLHEIADEVMSSGPDCRYRTQTIKTRYCHHFVKSGDIAGINGCASSQGQEEERGNTL